MCINILLLTNYLEEIHISLNMSYAKYIINILHGNYILVQNFEIQITISDIYTPVLNTNIDDCLATLLHLCLTCQICNMIPLINFFSFLYIP